MAGLENSTFKFLRQNKYFTRYFNTNTYQRRKSQLQSTLEASALIFSVTLENSVVESSEYNTENNLEGPKATSYAIFLPCTEHLT